MSGSPLTYTREQQQGWDLVFLTGPLTEHAVGALKQLIVELGAHAIVDMAAVSSVNSSGIAEWLTFLDQAGKTRQLLFDRCSPSMVNCFNLVPATMGRATVRSVLVPSICTAGHPELRVLLLDKNAATPPALPPGACQRCGAPARAAVELLDYLEFREAAPAP